MTKFEWIQQQVATRSADICLHWVGSKSTSGYGMLSAPGNRGAYAHRVAYELVVGPIPPGLEVDHLCRVRDCFNPDHLEPVTSSTNKLRGMRKQGITHCPSGHPYDEINTRVSTDGGRDCRACGREANRRYRMRRKAA